MTELPRAPKLLTYAATGVVDAAGLQGGGEAQEYSVVGRGDPRVTASARNGELLLDVLVKETVARVRAAFGLDPTQHA